MRQEPFLLRWAGKAGSFCILSILWLVSCLPVVTAIPACIALYDSVVRCVLGDEDRPGLHFWRTFKRHLLRGIVLSILWLAIAFVIRLGYRLSHVLWTGTVARIYTAVYAGSTLIPLGVLAWLIPIQAHGPCGLGRLHSLSLTMTILALPTTAAVLGILFATVLIVLALPPLIVIGPGICVTIQAHVLEKAMARNMVFTEEENNDTTV